MITKNRMATILNLALPITLALLTQFIMYLVDMAMVSPIGNKAVAAIGISSFCYTFIIAFVIGVAPAVQGIVARRSGEHSREEKCLPLNGGLFIAIAAGIPLSILCYFLSPVIFSLISSDPEVTKEGIPYLRMMYISIIAAGMNAAFRGYWTGVSRAKVYMQVILLANCVNIFLNYVLIYGNFGAPELGTLGAGVASVVSLYVASMIFFVMTVRNFKNEGFLKARPERAFIVRILTMGIPASMQEAFFSMGFIVFFWMVGQIGTAELAASNVIIRVVITMLLFAMALGMASTTLVSRTLGEGDPLGAARWGWDTGKIGLLWITLLGLPLILFPEAFLFLFISDPYTISIAVIPLQLAAATTGIAGLIYIFGITLMSIGDGNRVLLVSFTLQWFMFLPAVWIIGPYLNYGLLEISFVQVAYSLIAAGAITALWSGGRWKTIKI